MEKTDGAGDNLPLPVGQSDDLRGHNNLIGALRRAVHADVFAAVVKKHRDLQQKALSFSHAVNPLRAGAYRCGGHGGGHYLRAGAFLPQSGIFRDNFQYPARNPAEKAGVGNGKEGFYQKRILSEPGAFLAGI